MSELIQMPTSTIGILRPLFDSNCHLKEGGTGGSSSSQSLMSGSDQWVTSTCRVVMTSAVSIFTQFFHRLSFLLGDYLCLFLSCILQDNEKLADIGSSFLVLSFPTLSPFLS